MFYLLLYSINPFIGLPLTLRYLCIIVLGGLGSLFGTLLGGVMLGLTEVFTGYLLRSVLTLEPAVPPAADEGNTP